MPTGVGPFGFSHPGRSPCQRTISISASFSHARWSSAPRSNATFVGHDGPGLHPILGYGVAIKLGERVISRCDYTLGQGKARSGQ